MPQIWIIFSNENHRAKIPVGVPAWLSWLKVQLSILAQVRSLGSCDLRLCAGYEASLRRSPPLSLPTPSCACALFKKKFFFFRQHYWHFVEILNCASWTTMRSISKLGSMHGQTTDYDSQVDQMDSNPNRKALSWRCLKNSNAMKKTTYTFLYQLYLLKSTQVVNSCIIYTFLMQICLASFNNYQIISLHSHCRYIYHTMMPFGPIKKVFRDIFPKLAGALC